MGRVKLPSGMNANEGECDSCDGYSTKAALACVINSEIGAVLAVMRRNVRWGMPYMFGDEELVEHSLIQSLKALRKKIFTDHWKSFDPSEYFQPFLDVIQSDETGAPITGVALSSVYKILTFDAIDQSTLNVENAMHLLVDAVTSCRFEVTDPGSEEVVLMKILQVLLACLKSKASVVLSNQHVCNVVNTCFRIVHQAGSKGELLQRIARHTINELIRCIFSHLPDVDYTESAKSTGLKTKLELAKQIECEDISFEFDGKTVSVNLGSNSSEMDEVFVGSEKEAVSNDARVMNEPFGVPCMVQIFEFLCSLLDVVEHAGTGPRSNTIAYDEDVPLFALGLINSAIELVGPSIRHHPSLLNIIQDELFHNLMQFGLSMSPLTLSMVCSIVLNLCQHLRTELKLQIEAFFSCVILRLAQAKHGASYQQQEVAMEALVDFCRQKTFMVEMYANFDCDLTCSNLFEEVVNLLSKSAFPVNSPLSSMHVLALDGLVAVIQGMAERLSNRSVGSEKFQGSLVEYAPFWIVNCEDYTDPSHWVPFIRWRKHIKRKLMVGAEHYNQEPKKGLEFLQGTHLLPEKLDPHSVAGFFRYTSGLDKDLIGDYLGNHDEFCVQVLNEFARTFDFQDMQLDTALRLFLETFRLPGESQKIQRVLEAFSERYYEQSTQVLANKDAALLLSYSIILLNTDLHNKQVKKKMTEEDFIRNNRLINGGKDLPREFLSELYHSICKNEIRTTPEQGGGFPQMNPSRWIDLIHKSKKTAPFIVSDSRSHVDHDMFALIAGPTIAALSVVFDHAEHKDVYQTCIDGFLAVAKISAHHHLEGVLNDLVVSLCKFTTLLNPSSFDDPLVTFGDDTKAKMATVAVFTIANRYGDYLRTSWRNILDCVLRLHKLGLLPARLGSDDSELAADYTSFKPLVKSLSVPSMASRRSYSLMGRFSQFLSLDTEEPISQPTEEDLAAHQRSRQTIQECNINNIFIESKFLQAESLQQLSQSLILASGRNKSEGGSFEDEDTAVFCLELLITITLNNRDRIALMWQDVYEHVSSIVQSTVMPCTLVEKAVFGILHVCQRLLPYKEDLADELLRSLQLVLKLDARVADAYCEQIAQEVGRLVKANAPHIRSQSGWRTITSLLSITARHPEASESGFDTLLFIMSNGAHLLPANYVFSVDAARQFAESRVGEIERSVRALDLMTISADCLARWASTAKEAASEEDAIVEMSQNIGEMWLRLVQGLRKVCLDQREEVRTHALLSLQKCLKGVDGVPIPYEVWSQCFDVVIFTLLDDLVEIAHGKFQKDNRNMEGTLIIAIKLLPKVLLHLLPGLAQLTTFSKLWPGVLSRMENYQKVKVRGRKSEKLQEIVPELLKNVLFVMKTSGILTPKDGCSLWELTWPHVNKIAPSLQSEVFSDQSLELSQNGEGVEALVSKEVGHIPSQIPSAEVSSVEA